MLKTELTASLHLLPGIFPQASPPAG